MKKISIAIDGPAASGKSTTAKLVAKELGYIHIDTGGMYRALTLKVLQNNINLSDEKRISILAKESTIQLKSENSCLKIYLDDKDVTDKIRTPDISRAVSAVSSYKGVREVMVKAQQSMSCNGGVVLEGRDIGTVVLPNAELKIFMIASVQERARRRKKELELAGIISDENELIREIELRDKKDSTRTESPLKKANDAVELDTSNMTIQEQVDFIVSKAKNIINDKK